MADLLAIGASGLSAARTGLNVAAENIANVGTEGFRRRDAVQEEITGGQASPLLRGIDQNGVQVTDIRRAFDAILADRARVAGSAAAAADTLLPHLETLEGRMMPGKGGPTEAMEAFFTSLGSLSSAPEDAGLRRVVIENGRAFAGAVADLATGLKGLADGVAVERRVALADANRILADLADLQGNIAVQTGTGTRNPLLDRRDRLLADLAAKVDVTVTLGDGGLAEVRFGAQPGGPVLLAGNRAGRLAEAGSGRLSVAPAVPQDAPRVTRMPSSGALAGLGTAATAIADAQSALDGWAGNIARSMNTVHSEGLTLDGRPGGLLFGLDGWSATPAPVNRGNTVAQVTVTDAAAAPAGPLALAFDAVSAQWRLQDGAGALLAQGTGRLTVPGLVIDLSGTAMGGDRLSLDNTAGWAGNLAFVPVDTAQIAAAGALRVSAAPGNAGDGMLSAAVSPPVPADAADLAGVLPGGPVEFLTSGVVGRIPAGTASATLAAMPRLAEADFAVAPGATLSRLSLGAAVFEAGAPMAQADFLSALAGGTLRTATGDSLGDLGLSLTETGGILTLSAREGSSLPAAVLTTGAGPVAGIVVADAAPAAALSVFTREGRQLSGPPLTADQAAALLTVENGFLPGAVHDTSLLNAPRGYGALIQGRASAAGDQAVLAGTMGGVTTWTAGPEPVRGATTLGYDDGARSVAVGVPAGASAAQVAIALAGAVPVRAVAETRVALDLPATGALALRLAGDNLSPVSIAADLSADGAAGVAAAVNLQAAATGIRAELSPDGARLVLVHGAGQDIRLSDVTASGGPVSLTRQSPEGQALGAAVTLDPGASARVEGTVRVTSALAFGLNEGGVTTASVADPFAGGPVARTIRDAGATQALTFPSGAAGGMTLTVTAPDGRLGEFRMPVAGDAAAMAATIRAGAPASRMTGAALAGLPPLGAQMRVSLGGQDFAIRMTADGPAVSGLEPGRLTARFDAANRLVVETVGGHADGAPLTLPTDAGEAARFGMGATNAPTTTLIGQPPETLPASFALSVAGTDWTVSVTGGGVTLPPGFPGSAAINGDGAVELTLSARAGAVRIAPQAGAADAGFATWGIETRVGGETLTLTATDGRVLDLGAVAQGTGTRLSLGDLPDEDLLVVMSGPGALRLSGEITARQSPAPEAARELRVLDAAQGIVGLFDASTGAAIATRTLDASGAATLGGFAITLTGRLATGDRFTLAPNTSGTGDARAMERLADLQQADPSGRGGFGDLYSAMLGEIGARVAAARNSAETTAIRKEAADSAQARISAVDLDAEAASLMRQQQVYQANAQVISVARQLFDTLMNAI